MPGYVFYSKECETCINLIKIMENQGLHTMFDTKCVDNMSDVDITRLGLRTVPTIVVVSTQNGVTEKKGLYEGKGAFEWINSVVMNRRQSMIAYAENTRKLIQINDMKKKIKDGLYEYCEGESSGISDGYSYWKDDMTKDIDTAHPKSFLPYGDDHKYNIITVPIDKYATGYKISKGDQEKMTRDLESARKYEDSKLKDAMEQQQISNVLNAENGLF